MMQSSASGEISAFSIAKLFEQWAEQTGSFINSSGRGSSSNIDLISMLQLSKVDQSFDTGLLTKMKIVAITHDDQNYSVGVLVKNQVTSAHLDKLPRRVGEVKIRYVGHTALDAVPPTVPQAANLGGVRFYTRNGRFCCGSSVTSAPIPGAGTMGALIRKKDGILYGLSNNHVTGDCNHTRPNMYIMCPAPMDADPSNQPPTAIGQHAEFIRLNSGDPTQVIRQQLDAAIFKIINETSVSSYQGESGFDTPDAIANPHANMKVMKVGRTSGLTRGIVIGQVTTPFHLPYQSASFRSVVHFDNIFAVAGAQSNPFSEPGDSGSLVMSEDGKYAVGLIFAGGNNVSYMTPISSVLQAFDASLATGIT